MGRLTDKENLNEFCSYRVGEHCCFDCGDCYLDKLYNRLAELEDKLESGELVELPCIKEIKRSGRTEYHIYFIRTIEPCIGSIDYYLTTDKSKAEARLKELQEEQKNG